MVENCTTVVIDQYLRELADVAQESSAEPIVAQLMAQAVNRLHLLCSALLHRDYPRLMRAPLHLESHELLSAVVMRLLKAMREVRPDNPRRFFALANRHIRWELNDLARRLDRQSAAVELHESRLAQPAENEGEWTANAARILDAIEHLPDDEREVFDLVRIQGMSHAEAAELIGVATKTVYRRLNRGMVLLAEKLGDLRPAEAHPEQ